MDIKLTQKNPEQDGFYLVRFGKTSGLHLVWVQTMLDGTRQIVPDVCPFVTTVNRKKKTNCPSTGKPLRFNEFPTHAYWSDPIQTVF